MLFVLGLSFLGCGGEGQSGPIKIPSDLFGTWRPVDQDGNVKKGIPDLVFSDGKCNGQKILSISEKINNDQEKYYEIHILDRIAGETVRYYFVDASGRLVNGYSSRSDQFFEKVMPPK